MLLVRACVRIRLFVSIFFFKECRIVLRVLDKKKRIWGVTSNPRCRECFHLSLINVNLVTKPGTLSGLCSQDWLCFSSCISISHGSQSALSRCYSAWYAANTENCCCSVVLPSGYWIYDSMSSQSNCFCFLALSSNNLPFTFLATSTGPKYSWSNS